MANLWFKQRYVDPILAGEKTATIRRKRPRFGEGDLVSFHVGPKSPFAVARIASMEEVAFKSLDETAQEGVRSIYGERATVWRIGFEVVDAAKSAEVSGRKRASRE